ncbi:MAG: hypothetical protein C4308_06985 [Chitinophagaceae bacterium]
MTAIAHLEKTRHFFLLTAVFALCRSGFGQTEKQLPFFSRLSSEKMGIYFRNDIIETPDLFYYTYKYLYNGGGVSIVI